MALWANPDRHGCDHGRVPTGPSLIVDHARTGTVLPRGDAGREVVLADRQVHRSGEIRSLDQEVACPPLVTRQTRTDLVGAGRAARVDQLHERLVLLVGR